VVDVGCGDGTWLEELHELGITDTRGLDGKYIDRHILQVAEEKFTAVDLSMPFSVDRVFDLAMALEVGEHLPALSAFGFVESLTKLAPVVLFSAAIPFQGGTEHLNEQWPEYWAEIFSHYDYLPIDCIRSRIWANGQVEFWYSQNILLFASSPRVQSDPVLLALCKKTNPAQLALVHPRKYLQVTQPAQCGVRGAAVLLAEALKRAARRRLKRLLHALSDPL
jgi:hypothetical protein